jgi:hypothetical protein
MTANPSAYTGYDQSILVVNPNTLSYGTYMFTYSVKISYSGGNLTQSATSNVSVVPAGLNVFGFTAGVQQQTYGTAQQIVIDPGSNSIDLDSFVNPANLSYSFYCKTVSAGQSGFWFLNFILNLISAGLNLQTVNGDCLLCKYEIMKQKFIIFVIIQSFIIKDLSGKKLLFQERPTLLYLI